MGCGTPDARSRAAEFTPECLTAVALRLPAPGRARVAEVLLDSLDAADPASGWPASAVFADARAPLAAGEFTAGAARGA